MCVHERERESMRLCVWVVRLALCRHWCRRVGANVMLVTLGDDKCRRHCWCCRHCCQHHCREESVKQVLKQEYPKGIDIIYEVRKHWERQEETNITHTHTHLGTAAPSTPSLQLSCCCVLTWLLLCVYVCLPLCVLSCPHTHPTPYPTPPTVCWW